MGDCFGEFCTFAFNVACRVEMRDVRLFFPSRPGSDVSPGTQRSLVRYATQLEVHNFTFPNWGAPLAQSHHFQEESACVTNHSAQTFPQRVHSTGGTKLRPISGWLRDSLKARCKTGLGWGCGISHIRRSTAINLPGTGAAQLWPFFTPDWRRFAKPFLEAGIKRIFVAVLQFFACHMLHQGKR